MAEEKKNAYKHRIIIDEREEITITGVGEVLSFDDETIVCATDMGIVVVRGNDLHIERLDPEAGILSARGNAQSLEYTEEGIFDQKGGLLRRIFR